MSGLVEEGRAKVNLTLRVVGRRTDGYHDLESVVAFADCADKLTLTPGPELSLQTVGPLAMACGIATLKVLKQSNPYAALDAATERLVAALAAAARSAGVPHQTARCGSMFTLFFNPQPVVNNTVAGKCDTKRFSQYFWGMLERLVYLPCSQFEASFVSTCHSTADIDATITAGRDVLAALMSA